MSFSGVPILGSSPVSPVSPILGPPSPFGSGLGLMGSTPSLASFPSALGAPAATAGTAASTGEALAAGLGSAAEAAAPAAAAAGAGSLGGAGFLTGAAAAGLPVVGGQVMAGVTNKLLGSHSDSWWGNALQGAEQGGGIGAGLGTVFPGVGNLIGMGLGAAAGGVLRGTGLSSHIPILSSLLGHASVPGSGGGTSFKNVDEAHQKLVATATQFQLPDGPLHAALATVDWLTSRGTSVDDAYKQAFDSYLTPAFSAKMSDMNNPYQMNDDPQAQQALIGSFMQPLIQHGQAMSDATSNLAAHYAAQTNPISGRPLIDPAVSAQLMSLIGHGNATDTALSAALLNQTLNVGTQQRLAEIQKAVQSAQQAAITAQVKAGTPGATSSGGGSTAQKLIAQSN